MLGENTADQAQQVDVGHPQEVAPQSQVAGESPTVHQVEQSGSRPEGEQANDGRPKGDPAYYYLRQQKKSDDRLNRLEQSLSQLADSLKSAPRQEQATSVATKSDFWDSPEQYISQLLEQREKALEQKVSQTVSGYFEQMTNQQKLQLANQYIAALGDFTDGDQEHLATIVKDYGLQNLAKQDPEKAAKVAYMLWKEERGVTAPSSNGVKPSKAQVASVRGNAPTNGRKEWTKEEIAKIAGTPEFNEKQDEIRAYFKSKQGQIT